MRLVEKEKHFRTCCCSHGLIGDIVVRGADASAGEHYARGSHNLFEAQQRGLDVRYVIWDHLCSDQVDAATGVAGSG